jgi:enolase-phosphatase E1
MMPKEHSADSCPVQFPYALRALPETLRTKWDSPEFAQYRNAFPAEHSSSPEALEAHVQNLMSRDVKISYLKSLQGYLWEAGYRTGEIKSPLFPDVAPKFKSWTEEGKQIVIYSSGSVAAQKLLFRHTNGEPADLTPVIADYFDTVNAGPKMEAASYEKIMSQHPVSDGPSGWLFLSDNVKEVEAAKAAGMQSFVVQRPGNAPLPEGTEAKHKVISDFTEL